MQLQDKQQLHTERLLLYPAVLFISFLPVIVEQILESYGNVKSTTVTEFFRLLITQSLGLTNALVYGYQRGVYTNIEDTESESVELSRSVSVIVRLESIERSWKDNEI